MSAPPTLQSTRVWLGERWWTLACVFVYLVLVLSGITNSSIAMLDDPSDGAQGLIVGEPRPIRSDEWIKATPQMIGQYASGDGSFMPVLGTAVQTGGRTAAGPFSAVLNAEYLAAGQIARLDLDMAIAAAWWFPALVFALSLPVLLRRFAVPQTLGIAAVIAIAFSPANAWWSWWPVRVTAYAVAAGAAAALAAGTLSRPSRFKLIQAGLWVAMSGVLLAKLALSYTPWMLAIGGPILTATMAALVWRRENWKPALAVIIISAALGIALAAGSLAENREYYEALASTVYPGSRQVIGRFVGLPLLLGAPQLWFLQKPGTAVAATNASELSSAYTVLAIMVLAAGAFQLLMRTPGERRVPRLALALGLPIVGLLLWCSVTFPEAASSLPVVSRIPPERVAQVIGVPITLLAVVTLAGLWRLSERDRDRARSLGVVVGVATFTALAPSASNLKSVNLPDLPVWSIWGVSAAWAIGLGLAIAFPRRAWALAPLCALAVASTIFVNPAQQGTADLRSSDAAVALEQVVDQLAPGDRVAIGDPYAGAILMANAIPMVNGYQGAPDEDAWRAIDPQGSFEGAWNRGASLVSFEWLGEGEELEIVTPQADVVVIRADPCDPTLDGLDVGAIVSGKALGERSCLAPVATVTMAGQPKVLYLRGAQ